MKFLNFTYRKQRKLKFRREVRPYLINFENNPQKPERGGGLKEKNYDYKIFGGAKLNSKSKITLIKWN